ncbi:MAG: hypothetical protein ABFD96_21430 [Armatimonadia bacterium]
MRTGLVVALLLLLTACAANRPLVWSHPTASPSVRAADSYACHRDAQAVPMGVVLPGDHPLMAAAMMEQRQNAMQEMYWTCMESKGYSAMAQ